MFQESTESRLRSRSHGTPLDLPQTRMSMSVRRRAGLKVADCPAMLSVQLLANEGLPVEEFSCEVPQSGRRRPWPLPVLRMLGPVYVAGYPAAP